MAFACYINFVSHLECPVETTVLTLQPIGGGIYIIVKALLILKLLAVNGPRLRAVSSDTDSSLPIISLVSGVKYYIILSIVERYLIQCPFSESPL